MNEKRLSGIIRYTFLLMLACSLIFLLYFSITAPRTELLPDNYTLLDTWEWEAADGTSGTATLPCDLDTPSHEPVTFRTVLPESVRDNEWLCLHIVSSFKLYINGVLRKEFDEDKVGIPGSIEKSTFVFCELSAADAGATVEVLCDGNMGDNGFFRPVYLGSSYSISHSIIQPGLYRYIAIIVLFVVAGLGILLGVILSLPRREVANILFVSVGILLVCLWLILDDKLYPFFFPNVYIDGIASYLMAMLAPFPFMIYVDRLQKKRFHQIFLWLELFDILYFLIVCIARFWSGVVLSEHLLLYNLPIILMGIVWAYPIITEIVNKTCRDYQIIIYGLMCFMLLSVLDIILINLPIERTDGNLILAGLYVLTVAAFFQQLRDSMNLFQTLDTQSRQIDEIRRSNRSLELRAQTDPMTGLFNNEYLRTEVPRRLAENEHGILLLFDLDDFKQINDTYGHLEGNRVLIAFANALRKSFRSKDVICRLGGDEFVVFMSGIISTDLLLQKRNTIMTFFRMENPMAPYNEQLGMSMGSALVPDMGTDFETLYRKADAEMYQEKNKKHCR